MLSRFRSSSPPSFSQQSLLNLYQSKLLHQGYKRDAAQQIALSQLQLQRDQLSGAHIEVDQGLYISGPVGRGKTMLMDLFFHSLPEGVGMRMHFYRFMERLHDELRALQGTADPLQALAKQLRSECRVLCLDEFFVSDIADAMLLGRLLHYLFAAGLRVVTTSNCHTEQLYLDGLHRDRFLPAIYEMQAKMKLHHIGEGTDHRLQPDLAQQGCYFVNQPEALANRFASELVADVLQLRGRRVKALAVADRQVWFKFSELCETARSALDYIEIAKRFDQVLVSGVPQLGGAAKEQIKARGTEDGGALVTTGDRKVVMSSSDDAARRFISLVDELYDQRVILLVEATVPLEQLYVGERLTFEFERTRSRLTEMAQLRYQQRE